MAVKPGSFQFSRSNQNKSKISAQICNFRPERCRSTNHVILGQEEVNSKLHLLLMVGRCCSRPDIRIWDQDGHQVSQVRGFHDLTRPKSQPKSATLGGCNSTNHIIHGCSTANSHLHLLVMVGRCCSRPDIRVGDQDGHQARGFPQLTRPKIQPKSSTSGEVQLP